MRLDKYLFKKGWCESIAKAAALVMAGRVYVGGCRAESAGQSINEAADVSIKEENKYVSRGGLKLEKALQVFKLNLAGKVCMDIGASTGGFSDCMLQNGAAKVYAVDVAYGQLAWQLRCNSRVVNMERCNIRNITQKDIQEKIEFFSVDVSFISLRHIFAVLPGISTAKAEGVCLVKPQFEAKREQVGKNGVVKDKAVHAQVIQKVAQNAQAAGFDVKNIDYSPITGPKGNIEFLMHLQKQSPAVAALPDVLPLVNAAHKSLFKGEAGA